MMMRVCIERSKCVYTALFSLFFYDSMSVSNNTISLDDELIRGERERCMEFLLVEKKKE